MRSPALFMLRKHQLHQQHIAQRAAGDGEQRFALPPVERDGHGEGKGLGDAVAACAPLCGEREKTCSICCIYFNPPI